MGCAASAPAPPQPAVAPLLAEEVSRSNRRPEGELAHIPAHAARHTDVARGAQATDDSFWTDKRIKTFKAVLRGGVKAVLALCQEYKSALPFPGGPGVALIGHIAELIETALANKDNLEALLERAAELMDVIIEKHIDQDELASCLEGKISAPRKAGSRKYCNLMERLQDLLQEILQYTKDYTTRNFILKLLMTSYDKEQYQEMADNLARLMVDAHFSVSLDTHAMTIEVHTMTTDMKAMLHGVRQQLQYVDHSTEVQRMVQALGGIDNVLSSQTKIEQVSHHLDAGQQITIAMLQSQVQAAFQAAAAENDKGIHTIIRHTDMRTFWRQFFSGLPKVDWDTWWCAFPGRLDEVVKDKSVVDQIVRRLSEECDRQHFQAYLEKAEPETLSVREVELAFPYGTSLLEVLDSALGSSGREECPAGPADSTEVSGPQEPSRQLVRQPSLVKGARCSLPELDKAYIGRDKVAQELVQLLNEQLSRPGSRAAVCIVAGAGMGKSTLSIDVGWRLMHAGACPGGALMVDLRGAGTMESSLGRFCGMLSVSMDENAMSNISEALAYSRRKFGGPALLLMDNAEDLAQGHEGQQFAELLSKLAAVTSLVITSRVPVSAALGIQRYDLESMGIEASRVLLRSVAPSLDNEEVDEAVHLCSGVPLLLHRVGDALRTGQIVAEDLLEAAARADQTNSILHLTLCTLSRQQQSQLAQLAVFPSSFKPCSAAAVLGCDEARAHGLLSVLYRHGLVTREPSTSLYSLHMAVREDATAIGGAKLVLKSQVAFVAQVMEQISQWTALFFTPAWEMPLSLARDASGDILAAFDLAGKLTQQASPPTSLLSALLGMDAFAVEDLLHHAGLRRGTWERLQHLHAVLNESGSTSDEQLAAAAVFRHLAAIKHLGSSAHADAAYSAAAEAQERYAKCHGQDKPQSISCLHAMGCGRREQGRYTSAVRLFQQSYDARLRAEGKHSSNTWRALRSLAKCLYSNCDEFSEAEQLYKQLHSWRHEALGPLHPDTLIALTGVANCLFSLGNKRATLPIYLEIYDAQKQAVGADNIETLHTMTNLARNYEDLDHPETERMFRESLEAHQAVLGDHPDTEGVMEAYASFLEDQGRDDEANALLGRTRPDDSAVSSSSSSPSSSDDESD